MSTVELIPCQGLPHKKCPLSRCDKTVRNTIYDLFLCHDCERIRDEEKSSLPSSDPARDAESKKSRDAAATKISEFKEVSTKKATKQTKKQLVKDVGPSCVNPAAPASLAGPMTNDCTENSSRLRQTLPLKEAEVGDSAHTKTSTIKALTIEILQLKEVAAKQDVIIKSLTEKLSFVLSYLEIDSDSQVSSSNAVTKSSAPQSTYASITARLADDISNPNTTTAALSKVEAVTAVYVDIAKKTKRESNIIISGISPTSTLTDTQIVFKLCSEELAVQPDIIQVRRLGHDVAGRIQPLLVVLRQASQAQQLLCCARDLRKSSNPDVKNVYINPNLTPAEAAAAYELRVQRRLSTQRRRVAGSADISTSATGHSTNQAQQSNNRLNVSASDFVPLASGRLDHC